MPARSSAPGNAPRIVDRPEVFEIEIKFEAGIKLKTGSKTED
jgi:hypothetical protein